MNGSGRATLRTMPVQVLRYINSFLDYQYTYFLYFVVEWYDRQNRLHFEKMSLSLDDNVESVPDMLYTDICYARHMFEIGYGLPDQPWTYGVKYDASLWRGVAGTMSPFQFVNTIWLGKRDNRNRETFERTHLCTDEYMEHNQQVFIPDHAPVEFTMTPGKITIMKDIERFIQKDMITCNWIDDVVLRASSA